MFEKNIDELIPTLTSMKKEDSHLYNKKQIMMIATKLGIKYYKTQDKPVIMELIDKHLEDKLKEETRIAMNNIGGEINLNGITVLSREEMQPLYVKLVGKNLTIGIDWNQQMK